MRRRLTGFFDEHWAWTRDDTEPLARAGSKGGLCQSSSATAVLRQSAASTARLYSLLWSGDGPRECRMLRESTGETHTAQAGRRTAFPSPPSSPSAVARPGPSPAAQSVEDPKTLLEQARQPRRGRRYPPTQSTHSRAPALSATIPTRRDIPLHLCMRVVPTALDDVAASALVVPLPAPIPAALPLHSPHRSLCVVRLSVERRSRYPLRRWMVAPLRFLHILRYERPRCGALPRCCDTALRTLGTAGSTPRSTHDADEQDLSPSSTSRSSALLFLDVYRRRRPDGCRIAFARDFVGACRPTGTTPSGSSCLAPPPWMCFSAALLWSRRPLVLPPTRVSSTSFLD
uniref:Uncharacterized protein n=1 Tax=Mycena chlorophos TaxID=658473 RepID=A0ABQ0LHD7_MYCCL|nr:predicted protein [Mycena chlorophos]